MKRTFKIHNTKFSIVNRYTGNMEVNSRNPKYNLMMFDTFYKAWKCICSCMTIAEGHEIAENYMEFTLNMI